MSTTTAPTPLLIVDEDELALRFLADNLTADGYHVQTAASAGAARLLLAQGAVALIVVDVNGRTLGLIDALRAGELTAVSADTPALVLTSQADQLARVRLLEHGADDVQQKPFSYVELRARIRTLLRRAGPLAPATVITVGPIAIALAAMKVTVNDEAVHVTRFEYMLLLTLAQDPERVFTRSELLCSVRGTDTNRGRTLDSHASRLRCKLAAAGAGEVLQNVWGVGYRLTDRREQLTAQNR